MYLQKTQFQDQAPGGTNRNQIGPFCRVHSHFRPRLCGDIWGLWNTFTFPYRNHRDPRGHGGSLAILCATGGVVGCVEGSKFGPPEPIVINWSSSVISPLQMTEENFTRHSRGVMKYKPYFTSVFLCPRLSGVVCQVFPGGCLGVSLRRFQAAELGVRAAIAVNTHVEMVKQIAAEAERYWTVL